MYATHRTQFDWGQAKRNANISREDIGEIRRLEVPLVMSLIGQIILVALGSASRPRGGYLWLQGVGGVRIDSKL